MNLLVHSDEGELHIVDGKIAPTGAQGSRELDATGLRVAPGLLDLQVNGARGIDITSAPERLWEVAAALAPYGVTAFLPTVITSSPDVRERALATLAAGRPAEVASGAAPLGLHFEGPMIASSHRGAHPEEWVAEPSLDLVAGWTPEAGVAMVTIAPELPGAVEVVERLTHQGVVVSLGHTAASTADVARAVAAGASCVTHLFNAMLALHHREPGLVGAALDGSLIAGVIVDGHHLAPEVVRLAWRALGPERFWTVSDATAALGLPADDYVLGDRTVVLEDGAVRTQDGSLAGSATALVDCLRILVETTGCTVDDALATATRTPARLLGDSARGRLDPGCRGDLVLLDHNLSVVATVIGGEVVHDAREAPWKS